MFSSLFNDPFFNDPFTTFSDPWSVGYARPLSRMSPQRSITGPGQQSLVSAPLPQGRRGINDLVSFTDPTLGLITTRQADDMGLLSLERLIAEPLSLEVQDMGKEIKLVARAPEGIRKKDMHVEVQGNCLTISGERLKTRHRKGVDREEYHSFSRSILLPDNVDGEHIQAKFDQEGQLVIQVPKIEEKGNQPKQIQIQGGEHLKEAEQQQLEGEKGSVEGTTGKVAGGKGKGKYQAMETEKEGQKPGTEPRTQTV